MLDGVEASASRQTRKITAREKQERPKQQSAHKSNACLIFAPRAHSFPTIRRNHGWNQEEVTQEGRRQGTLGLLLVEMFVVSEGCAAASPSSAVLFRH